MSRPGLGRPARRWLLTVGLVAISLPSLAHSHPKPAVPVARIGETVYEVKSGDSLSQIAKRFGVSLRALIEANGLRRPDALRLGQRLVIPTGGRAPAALARASRPAAPRVPANFVLTVPDLDGAAPDFRWPLEGPISSPFGRRRSGWHAGIDIRAELGTPIFAAAKGTVLFSGWEKYYGRVVKVEHDNDFVTVYAHNLRNFVKAGDEVEAGQVIGTVGRSGRASTYHLHFEIRNNGKFFNPVVLLPSRPLEFAPDGLTQPEDGVLEP